MNTYECICKFNFQSDFIYLQANQRRNRTNQNKCGETLLPWNDPCEKMMPEQQSNGFYAVCCCLSVHLFVVLIKCFFYNGVKLPKMSDRWGSSIFHMEETPSFGKMLNNILQFNLKFWKKAICIMYCIKKNKYIVQKSEINQRLTTAATKNLWFWCPTQVT